MRTEKQIEASRLNGARSRGPVTPEGKQASSQNAVKHGFLAANILTKDEHVSAFLDLCRQLQDEFQPATPFEESLVQTMAVASWRRERIWNVERASLDLEMSKEDQCRAPDELTALAFSKLANESRVLDLIHRYETRYERQYFRAHKRLLEVQAARLNKKDADPTPPTPGPNVVPIDGGADAPPVCETNIYAKRTQPETLHPCASACIRGHALSANGDKFPGVGSPNTEAAPSQEFPNQPENPKEQQP
jgi:hypothetical protein